jgi:hypothetical protein
VIPEAPRSETPQDKSAEQLIRSNGDAIESLLRSEAWCDIAFPLLQELIAGVSGRFTNGRFRKGSLTKPGGSLSLEALSGYQLALEDFHNNLADFVTARDNLIQAKKQAELDKNTPVTNPFLEEEE